MQTPRNKWSIDATTSSEAIWKESQARKWWVEWEEKPRCRFKQGINGRETCAQYLGKFQAKY